ncbi:PadR family transcriptional regulator [Streptomyces triticirhizae]|uniref:PadR family transcriptional regulator n=1 Tax=Streptomyces triticirhizae TaxID=2483353 RepID=A0A3M2LIA1_9ACTN|nr:PadR family transcriptional regulator [Streptomyces triticirhizae]RMI36520.1 PadR family transcriptional regulator [Streptomyces triticirhizae]
MPPVFGHGRLRLYLLKLLSESPRHGYEVIRLLEERFDGLYAPSAGTVYPRLAKLASEGLVSHTEEGGRKVYSLTPEGERELAGRTEELTALERELRDSLTALAAGIREDVRDTVRDLRDEVRRATESAGRPEGGPGEFGPWRKPGPGRRRGGGRGRWEAGPGRPPGFDEAPDGEERPEPPGQGPGVPPGQEHFERAARRIQERVRSRATAGDWPGAVRAGLDGLGAEFEGWGSRVGAQVPWPGGWSAGPGGAEEASAAEEFEAALDDDAPPASDPARELERLLDRLRDDVRDAARDYGVSQEQLREARRHLSVASAHLVAMLRSPHA